MATFDPNKYKSIFEQRFGQGSYDKGLSNARSIGATKAQADIAKDEYNRALKEYESKMKNKSYSDALAYFSDPSVKDTIKKDGASKNAENIRNDPMLQEQIKAQGYSVDDYIDAMYNALSDGQFRSEREYKGYASGIQKESDKVKKERDAEYKAKYGMTYDEYNAFQKSIPKPEVKSASTGDLSKLKKKDEKKDERGLLERIKDFAVSKDVDGDGERDGLLGAIDRFVTPISKGATEFVAPGNAEAMAQNSPDNPVVQAMQKDRGLETKALNMVGAFGAAVAPYGQAYKTADVALNKIPAFARVVNPYARKAITGAAAGGMAEAGISGINEWVNPDAYDLKDHAIRTVIGVAGGAILDPAFHKLGNMLRSARAPKNTAQADEVLTLPEPQRKLPAPETEAGLQERLQRVLRSDQQNANQFDDMDIRPLTDEEVPFTGGVEEPTAPVTENAAKTSKAVDDTIPTEVTTDPNYDVTKLNKVSGFRAATTDVYRIFKDVYGKDSHPVILKLDSAKKKYTDMQEKWVNKLKTEVVDKLGIKKNSEESALVQRYGEKNISLQDLKIASPNKWKDIVKADQWFRQAYDEIIDTINTSRGAAYPNNPDKLVPKLDNYYRHFREMNGLTGLKNIFDSPSQISPGLAGLSQHTNPSSKWHGFMQKRGMGPYKEDAVGGFLEYIPGASYATNIDSIIPDFKNLRKQIVEQMGDDGSNNQFIEFLYNYSNDLAGKTNPYFDRNLQQLLDVSGLDGRKAMSVLTWANTRVKKNVILGNIGSALAQLANIPNGIAFARQHSAKGLSRTLSSIVDKNAPVHKSPFLKERYIDNIYQQFDQRLIDQPEKAAGWLISTADRIGTSFVWNSVYEKGLKQGVKNPIKYADDNTRSLIAGRGVGEVPLMQKSKAVQLVMPFTLEVANLWHVMRDFVKAKDFGALATLFTGNWLLNNVMEETRGSNVTFDPVDAMMDALSDDDATMAQKGGRLLGEVLTNIPMGQHVAGLYPEYGQVFNFQGPTREELFGDRNPQRFGTGLLAANSLSDFAFKFALPFGGNQLKKTLNGLEALNEGGEYQKEGLMDLPFVGEQNKLRFPVESNLQNIAKAGLFGPSATNEGKEYYENDRRPLSEKQTNAFNQFDDYSASLMYYQQLMKERRISTLQQSIKDIQKDESLSQNEKQDSIQNIFEELQALQ